MYLSERQVKLKIGMMGIATQDIDIGREGWVYFPELGTKAKVKAVERIGAYSDVIVVDEPNLAKERSPLLISKIYGYVYYDYAEISYGSDYVEYKIGTKAQEANPETPLFEAQELYLIASTNCYVKFNVEKNLEIPLEADVQHTFKLRVKKIYVKQQNSPGKLVIFALG